MDARDYDDEVERTAAITGLDERLTLAALGMAGEAGEFVELVKKHVFHGKEIDRDGAIRELGDVLWYVVVGAHTLGATLSDVMAANVAKLRARYPDGFTHAAAAARADVTVVADAPRDCDEHPVKPEG